MPFNGVGVFQRLYNWTTDNANGLLVRNDRMDADSDDIALGLSNCITRDGQSAPTSNLPMGSLKFTGLGVGAVPTDSVNYGQVFTAPTFAGMAATGVVNFTGATSVSVPTATPGDNTTKAASTAFATALAFNTALPAQSLGFLRSSGTVTGFTQTHTGYAQKEVKGADIVCAATINLSTATGNLVHVTGAVGPVISITVDSGAEYTVVWDATPTINHNSVSLILPTAAPITVSAGDVWKIRGDGAGNARVVGITKADGTPIKGGMTLLATLTPTAAANLDFLTTFTAAFDNYLIIGEGLTNNAGAATDSLGMRLANAGTADAGSKYSIAANLATTVLASSWIFTAGVLGNGKGCSFHARIVNTNDATNLKFAFFDAGSQVAATPQYQFTTYGGAYDSANAVSGFRLYWNSASNFGATGKIRVYGYNNS